MIEMLNVIRCPEDPDELASWLEQRLTSENFPHLIWILEEIYGPQCVSIPLEVILPEELSEVLESGLSSVATEQLEELLCHPGALVELHERIVLEGSDAYWNRHFSLDSVETVATDHNVVNTAEPEAQRMLFGGWKWVAVAGTLAASLLVSLISHFAGEGNSTEVATWSSNAIQEHGTSRTKLFSALIIDLQDEVESWNAIVVVPDLQLIDQTRRDQLVEGLASCISEYQAGCTQLTRTTNILTTEELGLCENWIVKLDRVLADLKSGQVDFEQALQKFNDVMSATFELLNQDNV